MFKKTDILPYNDDNVGYENKYTKRSSDTLLCLVYLFSERTLQNMVKLPAKMINTVVKNNMV